MPLRVAEQLGDRVRLNSPVRGIDQSGSDARLLLDGTACTAKRVIVAMPPTLAGRLIYAPALPLLREQLTQRMPQGSLVLLGPGALVDFGEALRAPVGRIHWAGTETSTYWNGYMDGAVPSGECAATEVLAAL